MCSTNRHFINLTYLLSCSDFNFTSPVSAPPHDSTPLRTFDPVALPYSSRLNIRHAGHVTVFSTRAFEHPEAVLPFPSRPPFSGTVVGLNRLHAKCIVADQSHHSCNTHVDSLHHHRSSLSIVMIYYIRFLKPPKISTVDHARSVVKALITVTSDLGECIYPADLPLWVTLFSPGDDQPAILSTRDFFWKRGMRCLSIEIDQRQIPMATWAARMMVTAHRRAVVDALSSETIPDFVSAWSDSFGSDATQGNSQWVMRRFEPREGIALNIREDTGESIARHVWWVSEEFLEFHDSQ